jgi:hypothetical protein
MILTDRFFRNILGTGLLSFLILSGCSRDSISRESLLTGSEWQLKDLQIRNEPLPGVSILNYCNSDNRTAFLADGKLLFDYGKIRCDSTEQQLLYDRWRLRDDGYTLEMASLPYKIVILDREYLRLLLEEYTIPGTQDTVDLYFMYERER